MEPQMYLVTVSNITSLACPKCAQFLVDRGNRARPTHHVGECLHCDFRLEALTKRPKLHSLLAAAA